MEQPDIFMSYLRLTQHMSQQFRSHFGRLNLTFPQALVLTVLGEGDPIPISTLAERTGSANSTVSGIVDRLEKLGLAKRQRSELDRRMCHREVCRSAGQGIHRCGRIFCLTPAYHAGGGSEDDRRSAAKAGSGADPERNGRALSRGRGERRSTIETGFL